jgi:uncharacterized protein YndB with AHSA1/START domain
MPPSSLQVKNNKSKVELPSDNEVRVTREFNAPAQLVWDAHTKPELMKRWLLGPDGWSMTTCEVDLRVGGKYHYRWRNDTDGTEFGFTGENIEVTPITRIVTMQFMEGMPGPGARNTLTLSEKGGKTILTINMDFGSKEARDGAVASGMTDGMEIGYQRIERLFIDAKAS